MFLVGFDIVTPAVEYNSCICSMELSFRDISKLIACIFSDI